MLTNDLTLDEANGALEKRLALLKHPQTPRPVFEFLVHDLNEILGSAIALFPAEANAVRISAAIEGHRKDPQKNIRTYAGDDIIGRLAEIRTRRAE